MKVFILIVALWACVQAEGSGSERLVVPLTNYNNYEYNGEIAIGNPPQKFNVTFDVNTAKSWVYSSKCSTLLCHFQNRYQANKSSTHFGYRREFDINFNKEKHIGLLATDDARISGLPIKRFSFVESVRRIRGHWSPTKSDGLIGLGYPEKHDWRPETLLNQLVQQKLIESPKFSIYLAKFNSTRNSQLVLGGVDPKHFTGGITYVPVYKDYASVFVLNQVTLTHKSSKNSHQLQKPCYGLVFSSSPFISGPDAKVDEIHRITGAVNIFPSFYAVDCKTVPTLPNITFSLNEKNLTLTPEDYVVRGERYSFAGRCLITITKNEGLSDQVWVLGHVFMRKFLTVFDHENDLIGFANAV